MSMKPSGNKNLLSAPAGNSREHTPRRKKSGTESRSKRSKWGGSECGSDCGSDSREIHSPRSLKIVDGGGSQLPTRPGTVGVHVPRSARGAGGNGSGIADGLAPLSARPGTCSSKTVTTGDPVQCYGTFGSMEKSWQERLQGASDSNELPPHSAPACLSASSSHVGLGFTPKAGSDLVSESDLGTLTSATLRYNHAIRAELEELRLSEHFGPMGAPSFRRLGVTLPAKKTPQVMSSFGSYVSSAQEAEDTDEEPIDSTLAARMQHARSARLALEAVEKDKLNASHRAKVVPCTGDDAVRTRQLQLIFGDIPEYIMYLPFEMRAGKNWICDATVEEERAARRSSDGLNRQLRDPDFHEGRRMEWFLNQDEVILLADVALLWQQASRGRFTMGIERPTFCRLCWDLELVDQERSPYYWIVSLFDEQAVMVRGADDPTFGSPPLVRVLSFWNFVVVIDLVIQQTFTVHTKTKFISKLKHAARAKPIALSDQMEVSFEDDTKQTKFHSGRMGSKKRGGQQRRAIRSSVEAIVQEPESMTHFDTSRDMDMHQEMLARERLVSCMLLEPEVIHLAMQQLPLYKSLFQAYTNGEGFMSAEVFLTFCADFKLVPDLVNTTRALRVVGSVLTAQAAACQLKGVSELPASSPDGGLGVETFMEVVCKIGLFYLSFYGNFTQQSSPAYVRLVWIAAYLRQIKERNKAQQGHHDYQGRRLSKSVDELSAVLHEGSATIIPPTRRTLVKIMRTNTTSSIASDSATPGPRFDSVGGPGMRRSFLPAVQVEKKNFADDNSSDEDLHEDSKKAAAAKAAEGETSSKRKSQDERRASIGVLLLKHKVSRRISRMRAKSLLLNGSRRKESLRMESTDTLASCPTDLCPECETDLSSNLWGNAFCRACAIVDTTSLEKHPFRRLLHNHLIHLDLRIRKMSERSISQLAMNSVPAIGDGRSWHSKFATASSFASTASRIPLPSGAPEAVLRPTPQSCIREFDRTIELFQEFQNPSSYHRGSRGMMNLFE